MPAITTLAKSPADDVSRRRRTAIGPWTYMTHDAGQASSSSQPEEAGASSEASAMSTVTSKMHPSPRRIAEITPVEDSEQ